MSADIHALTDDETVPPLVLRAESCPCGARLAAVPWPDLTGMFPPPSKLPWACVRLVLGLLPATAPGHTGSVATALHWRHVRVYDPTAANDVRESTDACICDLGRDHGAAEGALVRP